MSRTGAGRDHEHPAWRLLPWLAVAAVLAPVVVGGFPRGHDWSLELVRVAEFRHAVAEGQAPPAWAPNLYGGYGSPLFLFYAPAFSALAAALSAVDGSIAGGAAWAIVVFACMAVPGVRAMLAAAGTRRPNATGRVAVYLFVLNPYVIGDVVSRNACAEFAALCLTPVALAGLLQAGERPRHAVLLMSAGLAAVILGHNLTALWLAGALVLGGLVLNPPWRERRAAAATAAALMLGLALASFFWVPALSLQPHMRPEELLAGKFDYRANFPDLSAVFGYRAFFSWGLLGPAVLLGGAVQLVRRVRHQVGRDGRLLALSLGATVGFVFLATRLSSPVWNMIPALPLFQFPWRMLGPAALFAALAGALSFSEYSDALSPARRRTLELVVLVLALTNAAPAVARYRPLEADVGSRLGDWLAASSIRSRGLAATVGDEYLPRGADPSAWRRPRPAAGPLVSATAPVEVDVLADRGTSARIRVRVERGSRLEFGRWDFPSWQLRVDGRTEPGIREAAGTLSVDVPAGEHRIDLVYRSPASRRIFLGVSLVAVALWSVVAWRARGRPPNRAPG